jgi:tRNA threonylcarbamoyladenosine biosynthesis protein TsaB
MVTHAGMPSPPTLSAPVSDGPLLALDTSGPTARVALMSPSGVRLGGGERTGERHSAYLLPLCHEILDGAGVGLAGLAGIACGRGPGSFTGLRVGLALAKGLALPFDMPLHLVSSLAALALDLEEQTGRAGAGLLVPVIDAGKGEVYAQLAGEGELRLTPAALIDRLRESGEVRALAGTGVDRHAELFRAAFSERALVGLRGPSAEAVAALALRQRAAGASDDLSAAVPSYGRPPDITKPKPRQT